MISYYISCCWFGCFFGKIKVYKVELDTSPKDFVFLAKDLPVVGPEYKWNNYDKGYEEYGNYITEIQNQKGENDNLTGGFSGFMRTGRIILADHENSDQAKDGKNENYTPESRMTKNISTHNLNLLTINQLKPNKNMVVPKLDNTTPISFLSTKSDANRKANDTAPALTQISENNLNSDFENRDTDDIYKNNIIYNVLLSIIHKIKDFVFLVEDLPVVGPEYKWNNYDRAYLDYGNYISVTNKKPAFADSLRAYFGAEINSDLSSANFGGSGIVRSSSLSSVFSLTQDNILVKRSGPDTINNA